MANVCQICFTEFPDLKSLASHLAFYHGTEPAVQQPQIPVNPVEPKKGYQQCSVCFKMQRKDNLRRHMKSLHNGGAAAANPLADRTNAEEPPAKKPRVETIPVVDEVVSDGCVLQ